MNLQQILFKRDKYEVFSPEWMELNDKKMKELEKVKPSTKEYIISFIENDLKEIPEGFSFTNKIPNGIEGYVYKRSYFEYHPWYRHPIPYVIVKYQNKYFFILREKGSGELRLIGKKGLLGGHVGLEDLVTDDLESTIENALYRELEEEAGITKDLIENINIKGLIKNNEGVDADHLGFVYEIELITDDIKSEEDGVLTGIWINKEDLVNHYDSFESWSQIVFDNLLSL